MYESHYCKETAGDGSVNAGIIEPSIERRMETFLKSLQWWAKVSDNEKTTSVLATQTEKYKKT